MHSLRRRSGEDAVPILKFLTEVTFAGLAMQFAACLVWYLRGLSWSTRGDATSYASVRACAGARSVTRERSPQMMPCDPSEPFERRGALRIDAGTRARWSSWL